MSSVIVVGVGRLEDIAERNRNPRKHRQGRFPFGLAVAAFVFLILVLMIFTDADAPGGDPPEHGGAAPVPSDPDAPTRVRGVGIYVETPRDAAAAD